MRLLAASLVAGLAVASPTTAQQTVVDVQSLMTTPVWLYRGAQLVSQGTGFFYGNLRPDGTAEAIFLVTNYHVVTGHAPTVAASRSGDRIHFALHKDASDLEKFSEFELPLYDVHDEPVWASSDVYPNADVVLVPLPARMLPLYVFTEAHTRGDIKIRPTSGATLLGYPYGFFDRTHLLPVWKTGHVASEPDVDFEGEPTFLVDVSAFPGMSGSPVLAVATGIYESEEGVMRSGRVLKLLGIFSSMPVVHPSGRSGAAGSSDASPSNAEVSLQLGYVWKAALIADIARGYRPR